MRKIISCEFTTLSFRTSRVTASLSGTNGCRSLVLRLSRTVGGKATRFRAIDNCFAATPPALRSGKDFAASPQKLFVTTAKHSFAPHRGAKPREKKLGHGIATRADERIVVHGNFGLCSMARDW